MINHFLTCNQLCILPPQFLPSPLCLPPHSFVPPKIGGTSSSNHKLAEARYLPRSVMLNPSPPPASLLCKCTPDDSTWCWAALLCISSIIPPPIICTPVSLSLCCTPSYYDCKKAKLNNRCNFQTLLGILSQETCQIFSAAVPPETNSK